MIGIPRPGRRRACSTWTARHHGWPSPDRCSSWGSAVRQRRARYAMRSAMENWERRRRLRPTA